MKKFLLLLLLPLFFACSSDKKDEVEPKQDYTSVTLFTRVEMRFSFLATKEGDNFIKLVDIGTPKMHTESKEYIIPNDVQDIYIFWTGSGINRTSGQRIIQMTKNKIEVISGKTEVVKITDSTDPTQYPQDY